MRRFVGWSELADPGHPQLLAELLHVGLKKRMKGGFNAGIEILGTRVSSGHGSDRSASPKIVTGPKILTIVYGTTSNFPRILNFLFLIGFNF